MTLEEALEYLNLPANSRKKLIRKRYLELKKDYLKAIFNAPSDHFSALYRENLQKIEDAYNFLTCESEGTDDQDPQIQHSIQQIQQMVNAFLENKQELNTASRKKLKDYLELIDQLKNSLIRETPEANPISTANLSSEPSWHWEVDKLKEDESAESTNSRRYLYDRFLMIIIMAIVILGIFGTFYVLFPLIF